MPSPWVQRRLGPTSARQDVTASLGDDIPADRRSDMAERLRLLSITAPNEPTAYPSSVLLATAVSATESVTFAVDYRTGRLYEEDLDAGAALWVSYPEEYTIVRRTHRR